MKLRPAATTTATLARAAAALILAGGTVFFSATAAAGVEMQQAVPVWAEGRETEMNITLGFAGDFDAAGAAASIAGGALLKITASTFYRAYINGGLVASGPARAPHGFFRVDEIDISQKLRPGKNHVAVEVAGYNINGYGQLDQPSFLLAELTLDGAVALATGCAGWSAFQSPERVQKVQRYSYQRGFTEYYKLDGAAGDWRSGGALPAPPVKLAKTSGTIKLLPRRVPLPDFKLRRPKALYASGAVRVEPPKKYKKTHYLARYLTQIGPELKGWREDELEVRPVSLEIQDIHTASQTAANRPLADGKPLSLHLANNGFHTLDFGVNYSGRLGAKIKCDRPSRVMFYFDEVLVDGDVKLAQRMPTIANEIVCELQPGMHEFETIEAYAMRWLKIIALDGECEIQGVSLRESARHADARVAFASGDKKLDAVFAAAAETSRQNALDILMSDPSRERAGYLCDAYFAGAAERDFTGRDLVSYNFLENLALPETFANLPEGMLPMCWPADHYNGLFIPQWALWFVLHLDDYLAHGGDRNLAAQLRPRVGKLMAFFANHENSDGLLEKLPRWNFVEWSKANSFTKDVNYPTNMLYSAALRKAGKLYDRPEWIAKADKISGTVIRQSFNGRFFVDNAVRKDGALARTENTTEACQYYAFYLGVATPETFPELWKTLVTGFGPKRDPKKTHPAVWPANAFIGNYLRLAALSRAGLAGQVLSEIGDLFYPMAGRTGTLWEHMGASACCNEGFAAYAGRLLYRDALGIEDIDYKNQRVIVRIPKDNGLDFCKGSIPVGAAGVFTLEWKRENGVIKHSTGGALPPGFRVEIKE